MRQVALLRGINVGRNKRIAMADLRALAAGLGYADVSTHLRSGNLLLTSDRAPQDVAREVESAIEHELGLDVAVLVRTRDELATAVERNPLGGDPSDPSRLMVVFLSAAPDPVRLDGLDSADFAPERFAHVDREIFLWCPDGTQDSPLMKAFQERRLDVVATMRNWRTVTKLVQLLDFVEPSR